MGSSIWLVVLILFIVHVALDQLIAPTKAQENGECTDKVEYCWKCSDYSRYANDSIYQQNLNSVLSSFSSSPTQNQADVGFYNSSLGQGSDIVNAIALCRGDQGVEDCTSCVRDSTEIILRNCSQKKEAILWSEICMVRYSPNLIFGTVEKDPVIRADSKNNALNAEAFAQVLNLLLQNLRDRAASGNSSEKFAAGHAKTDEGQTIYALVQCTPDIDKGDCSNCLGSCISDIPSCCDGKEGARILKPSCNIRYEVSRFYKSAVDSAVDVSAPPATPTTPETPAPPKQGKKSNTIKTIIIIISVVVIAFVTMFLGGTCIFLQVKKPWVKLEYDRISQEMSFVNSLQYDFEIIRSATDDFSDANKLGQGGFGDVYKVGLCAISVVTEGVMQGRLLNGQYIAVKMLSKSSKQGDREFKNEVRLLAPLQHRNLVKLVGFCIKGGERLLIYEYVPNTSLNHYIFDHINHEHLDWETRYNIIGGIVRGLLYLHEDSRIRVIHCDLKLSNILLGEDMNPKIADFGTARLFVKGQTQGDAKTIVGTDGYMAPEYVNHGRFSVKSDVFSFGVIVLEIVSGKKISSFRIGDNAEDLLSYAWRNWRQDTILNIIDPMLTTGSRNEMIRCIHIGLLSVQENANDRPTMGSVASMLNSHSLIHLVPSKPAYYSQYNSESDTLETRLTLTGNVTERY